MKATKVLVTGAAGMLGNNIVRQLLREGFQPRCFIQKGVNADTLKDLDVETDVGDLLDPASLKKPLEDCRLVINAAAMTNIWPYRDTRVCRTNYQGVINLAEAAQRAGVERFIHIGSASSFDHGTRENPGDERSGYSGWKIGLDYVNSKYLSQSFLLGLHTMNGFPVIVINPTFMIGPYDSGPTSGRLLLSYYKGNLPGYPDGGKNFVHAGDVAKAAVRALSTGTIGECYIAGGENLTYREFFETAGIVTGRSFTLRHIPFPLLRGYAMCSSAVARITGDQPSISPVAARLSREFQFYSSEKLRNEMRIVPTRVQFAIHSCMEWFKENGYV
jgi:dihydroflavonol-4-reductase